MSIRQLQALVRNGLYYLTEHADDEAMADGFDIYDVEHGILTGKIRKAWPREDKYEVWDQHWMGDQLELYAA